MFTTTLLNKIKVASKKIYTRIYKRTYEQVEFDSDCGIYLGFIVGSGVGSYEVIKYYKGQIYKPTCILYTVCMSNIGAILGGSWGCLCGYLYPYVLVGLPSILISYNIYNKYNNDDRIIKEIVFDDLSLTQKPIK